MYTDRPEYQQLEATTIIDLIVSRGFSASVHDGEEWAIKRSTDRVALFDAMGATDEESVIVYDQGGERIGHFWLIYGNGPGELIADHTANATMCEIADAFSAIHPAE